MKTFRKAATIALLLGTLLMSGCLYTDIQRPLGTEYHQTELGTKIGEANSYSLLWLFAWGDAGTKAAADAGQVKVIRHADIKVFSILFGLYARVTTVVYGD